MTKRGVFYCIMLWMGLVILGFAVSVMADPSTSTSNYPIRVLTLGGAALIITGSVVAIAADIATVVIQHTLLGPIPGACRLEEYWKDVK